MDKNGEGTEVFECLLYSRFVTMVLHDAGLLLGVADTLWRADEPALARLPDEVAAALRALGG